MKNRITEYYFKNEREKQTFSELSNFMSEIIRQDLVTVCFGICSSGHKEQTGVVEDFSFTTTDEQQKRLRALLENEDFQDFSDPDDIEF